MRQLAFAFAALYLRTDIASAHAIKDYITKVGEYIYAEVHFHVPAMPAALLRKGIAADIEVIDDEPCCTYTMRGWKIILDGAYIMATRFDEKPVQYDVW